MADVARLKDEEIELEKSWNELVTNALRDVTGAARRATSSDAVPHELVGFFDAPNVDALVASCSGEARPF
eukprot:7339769-Pyramimonas_sp.AAC.1